MLVEYEGIVNIFNENIHKSQFWVVVFFLDDVRLFFNIFWRRSGAFIGSFENILNIFLVFLLLTLSMHLSADE